MIVDNKLESILYVLSGQHFMLLLCLC